MVDGGPPAGAWRISSRSLNGETCVAVAVLTEGVLVRDTKDPTGAELLHIAGVPWQLFLTGLRSRGSGDAMWT